jgi:multidrug transporter EmrE-like cation transporter
MNDIYWIIIATIASASPVLLVKEYIKSNNLRFIVLAIVSYLTLLFTYIHLFKENEISKIYSLIKIAQLVIVALIAIQIHNEKINKNKIIGIAAGVVSIIYLSCS